MDIVFQQGVAVGGLHLGDDVLVIFQTLHHNVARLSAHGDGLENGGVGFLGDMAGDIVHTLLVVPSGSDPVAVGFVPNLKLHMVKKVLGLGGFGVQIAEQLGDVDAEAV